MSNVLAELSYDAGVRALDLQERAVEQLRARTGTLLAASSLIASFLGAETIAHRSGLGVLGWEANQDRIDELGRYYLGATIALGLQLIFWSWALATHIS